MQFSLEIPLLAEVQSSDKSSGTPPTGGTELISRGEVETEGFEDQFANKKSRRPIVKRSDVPFEVKGQSGSSDGTLPDPGRMAMPMDVENQAEEESDSLPGMQLVEDENSACDICREEESFDDDPIIFCDGCNVPVHIQCYGIKGGVPTGDWFCDVSL